MERSMTTRWTLTWLLLRSHVWLYPSITVSKSHVNTSTYVDTVTKNSIKRSVTSNNPKMTFDPTSIEVTCVTLSKDYCPNSHKNAPKHVDSYLLFFKNLNQRSIIHRWPLTLLLLRLHVYLYWSNDDPLIIVCPCLMGIYQCMWMPWSILQIWPHTRHIHTYVQNKWSFVPFWVKFRRNTNNESRSYLPANLCIRHCRMILSCLQQPRTKRETILYLLIHIIERACKWHLVKCRQMGCM